MKSLNKLILSLMCGALSVVMLVSGGLYIAFDGNPAITGTVDNNENEENEVKKDQNAMLIDEEAFNDPDKKYRGLRITHDYMSLSGEDLSQKVQYVKSFGFGGIITNDGWDSQYLINERKLDRLNEFVQEADKQSLRVWLYDEKGYPSGSAGDLTVGDNKEYQAIMLLQVSVAGTGEVVKTAELPKNFIKVESASILCDGKYSQTTATVENGKISVKGVNGSWVAYVYCVVSYEHAEKGYFTTYPNLINRDAVKKYIDVTYQTYADSIDNFGDIIEAFFDDEPQLVATRNLFSYDLTNPVIPYDYDIFDGFTQKYGYDLRPLLPMVFNSFDIEAQRARAHFYSHVGDLLSENFFGQIQDWCKANGTELSGHLLLEEQMIYHLPIYGDYIQCSARMGYPGFDILNPRPQPYITGISTGAKYASSPAWLNGTERVFVEICPVHDPDEYATNHLDYALGTMTFTYFDGGNQVATYYTQANSDKETGLKFNEYIGRLGSMLVEARNKNEIAIYYSIDSVAAMYTAPITQSVYSANDMAKANDKLVAQLAQGLRESGLDYVFLDDASLQGGAVQADSLKVGNFNFKTVIVPKPTIIDINTVRVLDKLISNGVNVIFVGDVPALSVNEADQAELQAFSQKHGALKVNDAAAAVKAVTTTVALTVEAGETVYVSPYEKNGTEFFFLANAGENDTEVTFKYEGAIGYRVYDPVTGSVVEVDSTYTIKSYRGLFVQPIIQQ